MLWILFRAMLARVKENALRALKPACLSIAIVLVGSTGVAAATPSITITVGPDPAESITTQLGVSGTDPSSSNSFILKVKPTGGEGCGANPAADKGREAVSEFESHGQGAHSASTNWTFEAAGSYLLCAWLIEESSNESSVAASTSTTVAVRPPHLALSIGAPARVRPKQTFQVSTTAQAETSRLLLQYILPSTGRGCPANAQAASGTSEESQTYWPTHVGGWAVDGGPFTETANETITSLGSYLVCAYFEYPEDSSVPEAAASAPILVVNPPPACVVPHLQQSTALARAERLILAAHCKVGTVRYLASKRYRRGSVIGLSPAPGSHHANSTAIAVTVSRGRPRRHR